MIQGSRLTFQLASPVASDRFDPVAKQGSKLRPIRSPMRLNFSRWRLKLLFSRQFGDLNFDDLEVH